MGYGEGSVSQPSSHHFLGKQGAESELLGMGSPSGWCSQGYAKVAGMQGGKPAKVERGKEPRSHPSRLLSKQDSLDAPLERKAEAEISLDVGEVWKQGMSWLLLMRVMDADVQDSWGPRRAVCGTAGLGLLTQLHYLSKKSTPEAAHA